MKEEHLEILDILNKEKKWIAKDDLSKKLSDKYDSRLDSDVIDDLKSAKLVKQNLNTNKDTSEYEYMIKDLKKANDHVSSWKLKNSVEELDKSITDLTRFQARSSAVETVFTIALLAFAFVQATSIQISVRTGLIFALVAGLWALILGGENLKNTSLKTLNSIKKAIWDEFCYYSLELIGFIYNIGKLIISIIIIAKRKVIK